MNLNMIANRLTRAVNKNIVITIIRKLNGELVNGKFKYEEVILDNISANKQPLTTDEKQALKELNDAIQSIEPAVNLPDFWDSLFPALQKCNNNDNNNNTHKTTGKIK